MFVRPTQFHTGLDLIRFEKLRLMSTSATKHRFTDVGPGIELLDGGSGVRQTNTARGVVA